MFSYLRQCGMPTPNIRDESMHVSYIGQCGMCVIEGEIKNS